jgi:hypothetical protein
MLVPAEWVVRLAWLLWASPPALALHGLATGRRLLTSLWLPVVIPSEWAPRPVRLRATGELLIVAAVSLGLLEDMVGRAPAVMRLSAAGALLVLGLAAMILAAWAASRLARGWPSSRYVRSRRAHSVHVPALNYGGATIATCLRRYRSRR